MLWGSSALSLFRTSLSKVLTLWHCVKVKQCYFSGVYGVFEDYLKYNVVTDVKVVQNSSIVFPSVTICNANRVHCGNLLKYVSSCEKVSLCTI